MRIYEKVFTSINRFKEINCNELEKNIQTNFNIIDKVAVNNGVIFILEKFSISLGCKIVRTVIIYEKEKVKVKIVTAGGKISDFLDMNSFKNKHNDVIAQLRMI
ncbi:hypothetical protein V5E38_23215 [Rossellomorea sp. GAMAL-10_SWC]